MKIEIELSDNLYAKTQNMAEGMGMAIDEYAKVALFLLAERSDVNNSKRKQQQQSISQSIKTVTETLTAKEVKD